MVPPRTLSSQSAEVRAQAATLVRGNARRYAELEISLFVQEAPSYRVQLRFNRPDDKGVHEPISGTATFNSQELLAETIDPVAYGQLLTRSLFQDQAVLQEFHDICTATEANSKDLRLRLVIDRKAHELHDVRWETLFHPIKMDSPLLTDEHILFSRFLGTRGFRPIPPFSHNPQKALLAIANPTDITHYRINNQPLAAIKVQDELDRAASCLGTINRDELFSVPASPGRVTLTHLLEKLHEGYTILYLICHGAMYTKGKLSPHLLLEKADGKAEPILVEELVKQLRGMSQLPQLVVLGSCQSAGNGMYSPGEKKMLATLGPKLAAAGIPAVVGMQGEISMDTLTRFMPTFFVEWQKDGQLDRAMAVARRTVIEQQDWWMPVLFTRLRDGCLWSTATTDNSHHYSRFA